MALSLIAQVVRRAMAVDWLDRQGLHLVLCGLVAPDVADVVTHRAQKRFFEPAAHMQ